MEVDPPSAMTRFGLFLLIGGVTLIFVMWGVLRYFDKPGASQTAKTVAAPTAAPTIPPLLARPSPSVVPP